LHRLSVYPAGSGTLGVANLQISQIWEWLISRLVLSRVEVLVLSEVEALAKSPQAIEAAA